MEKKIYIKPEIEVTELASETLMLTSSFVFNEEGGNEESLTKEYRPRRGKWGNLWYTDEQ
jgi:hypothetical protein